MSRRETRDSDSRHHRSRFDREPSPKRVRRDGKTATERPTSNLNLDSAEHVGRDQKPHHRLQDSLHMEAPVVPDSKLETELLSKEYEKKSNGYREGTKGSSDNIEAPRPRSHFQHDERAGQVGRSFRHREITDREWWKDSKDRHSGRATNRSSNNEDTKPREEKAAQGADHRGWRHDGSYKMEPNSKQPSKKRPSFRETKIPIDAGNGDKSATEVAKPSRNDPPSAEGSERKEERGKAAEKPLVERPDRRLSGERVPHTHRTETQRMKFQSRDRYVGGGSYRGRDKFNGRQGQRVEKWKHDLYDEANKSPTSKNEEDQIAKVEALLAS